MNARSLLVMSTVFGSVLLFACSADDAGGSGTSEPKACVAHLNPSPTELARPIVAFETEIAPILARSCAFASCHGSRGSGNHGVFLAAKSADEMTAVKNALVAPSRALPSMPYVTPGDPDNSFLLHKLDGDLCVLEEKCTSGSCGKSMPEGNNVLPEASRDAVRRWIAQGAK
jgi:hypothetical protein